LSDDNLNVENTDDLGAFEDLFFERKPEKEAVETEEVEPDEPEEEVEETEAEEETPEKEEIEDESEDEPEEPKKPNRKPAKERIQELIAEKYELERKAIEADRRALEAERKLNAPKEESKVEAKPDTSAPDPDAKDEKGEAKYPLGEFDPAYIRALTRYTIDKEQAEYQQAAETRRQEEAVQQARAQAQTVWAGRLDEAEKDIPDVKEKIVSLSHLFADVEPQYGQYLVDVVQTLENGPHVLAYLADNPKEAQTIVKSGPTGATISLGRLDARLAKIAKEPTKVTQAPPAPKQVPRGTGKAAMRADIDDLDAFEKMFFKKR
jgi:hypothetical protein